MKRDRDTQRDVPQRTYDFVGVVRSGKDESGRILIEQRGKFSVGETLDVALPRSFRAVRSY